MATAKLAYFDTSTKFSSNMTIPGSDEDTVINADFPKKGLLNDEQTKMIILSLTYITQIFNLTSIISNTLNMIVYIKLGFAETSNISLFALSATEFICGTLSFWSLLTSIPELTAVLPFNVTTVGHMTSAGWWFYFLRLVAWITAFISFERCLCIVIPLKVKSVITPKTTAAAIIAIVVMVLGRSVYRYWRWVFVWKFNPARNRTLLDIAQINTPTMNLVYQIMTLSTGFVDPFLSFLIVVNCTVFLMVHLKRNSSWRKSITSAQSQGSGQTANTGKTGQAQKKQISTKEERLVKLVVTIATIFIVCFIPTTVMQLCKVMFKEFSLFSTYRRIYRVIFYIASLGESVSSSVNIFVYYNMGSRYRLTLRKLFGFDTQEK